MTDDQWKQEYLRHRDEQVKQICEDGVRIEKLEDEIKRLRDAVNRAKDHSCDLEGADFGYLTCCQQRDYEGHKSDCYLILALAPPDSGKQEEKT